MIYIYMLVAALWSVYAGCIQHKKHGSEFVGLVILFNLLFAPVCMLAALYTVATGKTIWESLF